MTIVEALNLRAAFASIKCQLAEGGVDVSEVKTVNDLPKVLSSILPMELLPELTKHEEVKQCLENGVLGGLVWAFANEAGVGAIVQDLILASDIVNEDNLNG